MSETLRCIGPRAKKGQGHSMAMGVPRVPLHSKVPACHSEICKGAVGFKSGAKWHLHL